MKVVLCANGHFFDADEYEECPICGAKQGESKKKEKGKKEPKSNLIQKILGKNGKSKTKEEEDKPQHETSKVQPDNAPVSKTDNQEAPKKEGPKTQPLFSNADEKSNEIPIPSNMGGLNSSGESGPTQDIWSSSSSSSRTGTEKEIPANFENNEKKKSVRDNNIETIIDENEENIPLNEFIKKASVNEEGRTAGFFSQRKKEMTEQATKESASHLLTEPPVGWLVCVNGEEFGRSFNIHSGNNSIGRTAENDVSLGREMSVSRKGHAFVIYEPKKKEFYLKPGEQSGLTYLNEEFITHITALNAFDIISMGDAKMVFVPLCCEKFSWEDYITE